MAEDYVNKDTFYSEIRRIEEHVDNAVERIELKMDAYTARMDGRMDKVEARIDWMSTLLGWAIGVGAVLVAISAFVVPFIIK